MSGAGGAAEKSVVSGRRTGEGKDVRCRQRTCVGCGARRDQRAMLRIAAVSGAGPVVDNLLRAPGRGAYLCCQVACIEKALLRRAIERSLKLKNSVPASLRDDIMKVLSTTL